MHGARRIAFIVGVGGALVGGAWLAATPPRAHACSIAGFRVENAVQMADVIAAGTLRAGEGLTATLEVEGYYHGEETARVLRIDNRAIDLGPDCSETPTSERHHEGGSVVAFLRETSKTAHGDYEAIWAREGMRLQAEVLPGSRASVIEETQALLGDATKPAGREDDSGGSVVTIVALAVAFMVVNVAGFWVLRGAR